MNVIISKEFRFEASHVLPKHPGKCARLHGHSWVLRVDLRGPVNTGTGFVLDYNVLKTLVNEHVVDKLDHTHLGYGAAVSGVVGDHQQQMNRAYFGDTFYPSSENLVVAIGRILQPLMPEINPNVRLYQVSIDETCTSRATWSPDDTTTA